LRAAGVPETSTETPTATPTATLSRGGAMAASSGLDTRSSPIATSVALTGMPGRTRCTPFTMTTSPVARPSVTTRKPSIALPVVTGRYSTTFASLTTNTNLRPRSVPIARSSTSAA